MSKQMLLYNLCLHHQQTSNTVQTMMTQQDWKLERLIICSAAVWLWFLCNNLQINANKSEALHLSSGQLPLSEQLLGVTCVRLPRAWQSNTDSVCFWRCAPYKCLYYYYYY